MLEDFLLEEAERSGLVDDAVLRRIFEDQARVIDRVIATVGAEYARAAESRPRSSRERRSELVDRLLAGDLLDTGDLGLIAVGDGAREALLTLGDRLGARPLIVDRDDGTVWAWLGARREFDRAALCHHLKRSCPAEGSLAVGEPAAGLDGWRLTHRQAGAALEIAQAGHRREPTFYAEVALLAAAYRDELLATSLRSLYLEPLSCRPDGPLLERTLRAYLASGRNASSAAARLDADRRTVAARLGAVEICLGRPLVECLTDLELALELGRLDRS